VPPGLDQLGRDSAHGAVVGGEGLVELGHLAANGRLRLDQVDLEAPLGEIERGLHPGDAAADDHYRAHERVTRVDAAGVAHGIAPHSETA